MCKKSVDLGQIIGKWKVGRVAAFLLILSCTIVVKGQPLELLKENPHYFSYQGKPTVIVGSGEHYGAVMNLDFDEDYFVIPTNFIGLINKATYLCLNF